MLKSSTVIAATITTLFCVAALLPDPAKLLTVAAPATVPAVTTGAAVSRVAIVSGPVRVIDGDTVRIGAVTVRLEGIDAPEGGQECWRDGAAYDCGRTATEALETLLAHPDAVCEISGKDKYRRMLGHCWTSEAARVAKQASVNADMVRLGHAIAYRFFSLAYVAQEDEARDAKRGIWAGQFIEPHAWRQSQRGKP